MTQPLLQSVDNTLRLLELFNGPVQEMSLTDLSKALSVGKSTTHRLLTTLESRGFMEKNRQNGRWRIGMKIVHIGAHKLAHLNVVEECRVFLEELSAATGESSHLSFYQGGEITFMDKVSGSSRAVMSSMIGYRLPAYATGAGKLFLALLSPEVLENYLKHCELKALTPHTITSPDKLRERLAQIRSQGYSEDQQESEEGLVCFAAPVLNRKGQMVAALSLSGQTSRMNGRQKELIREVMAAAQNASRQCGWLPEKNK